MADTKLFRFVQLRALEFLDLPELTPPNQDDTGNGPEDDRTPPANPLKIVTADATRLYQGAADSGQRAEILEEAHSVLKALADHQSQLDALAQTAVHLRAAATLSYGEMVAVFALKPNDEEAGRRLQQMLSALPTAIAAADILDSDPATLARLTDAVRGGFARLTAMTGSEKITEQWPSPVDLARAPLWLDNDGAIRFPAEPQTALKSLLAVAPAAVGAANAGLVRQGQVHAVSIGDLFVVEETDTTYEMGDIAHIENVLKSERREREFTVNRLQEVETFSEREETRRQEQERVTNDNQSFQNAISSTVRNSSTLGVMAGVMGGFGPVKFAAGAMFTNTSSKASAKTAASSFAKSVMERAAEETTTRVLESRRQLSRTEVTDRNFNGFDNRQGPNHVVGIYRFVNKSIASQVRNYGARLMLDFVVPEPAAILVELNEHQAKTSSGLQKPEPFDIAPEQIDEDNFADLASRYGTVNVAPPPPFEMRINKSFTAEPPDKSDFASPEPDQPDLDKQNPNFGYATGRLQFNDIPEGYYAFAAKAALADITNSTRQVANNTVVLRTTRVEFSVGHKKGVLGVPAGSTSPSDFRTTTSVGLLYSAANNRFEGKVGPIELAWAASSAHGVAVSVDLFLRRSPEALRQWQLETWGAINQAYLAKLDAWQQEQALQSITGRSFGDNPALNRETERRELKASSLTILMNHDFAGLSAIIGGAGRLPKIDIAKSAGQAASIVFFEEMMDWENLAYQLYDYTWAGRGRWTTLASRSSTDPEHETFLRAGAAKVTVPVQPGAEIALLNLLAGLGIWTEELSPQAEARFPDLIKNLAEIGMIPGRGDPEEEQEGDDAVTMEVTEVPTNLVILQDGPDPNATGWVGPIELPPPPPTQ